MSGFTDLQDFSTDDVGARHSLKVWREFMREVYFKLDIATDGRGAMRGRLRKRSFANIDVSSLCADRQRVSRSRQLAKDDKVECYGITFPTQGRFAYRQHGNESESGIGDVFILNANEPYEVDIAQGAQMLCISLPCELVRARVRSIDDMCGKSRIADPAIASVLRLLAEHALAGPLSVEADRLQNLCLDVIDMMVLRPSAVPQSYAEKSATRVFERARQVMEARSGDPQFDLSQAAHACGVSVRHLQSAFFKRGKTFSSELLNIRLAKAQKILTSAADPIPPIGSVAAECGFISQAHFANRYRSRFGRSPRDDRR